MREKTRMGIMQITVDVIDPLRVERARTADEAMCLIFPARKHP